MNAFYFFIAILIFSLNNNPLANFQWKYRVILIAGGESEINQQLKNYEKTSAALIERDLVIIYTIDNKLHFYPAGDYPDVNANKLIKYYHLDNQKFNSFLIGKDGMIKERNNKIIPATKYFQAIDAMPMRISEMRKKGGK
jgi:hypothetical protein